MDKIEFIRKLSAVTDRPEADFAGMDPVCGYLRAWQFYTTTGRLPTETEAGLIGQVPEDAWQAVLPLLNNSPYPSFLDCSRLSKVVEPISMKYIERFSHKSKYHN